MVSAVELPVNTSATALEMAEEIFGAGVTVVSATYSGDALSSGIFTNGDTVSPGVVPSDSGVILSTGQASDFTNPTSANDANQATGTSTNTAGIDGDADLNAAAGAGTFDGSILEVTFVPNSANLTMQFVFSSEEFPEFVNSGFSDTAVVLVNGVEVPLTAGNGQISVDAVNLDANSNIFVDNANSDFNTEMDGFTVVLSLDATVNPGVNNTIKIGVADVGDSVFDTNLLIAGDSVQSQVVADDDFIQMPVNATETIDVLANDSDSGGATLTITQINGVAVTPGDTVNLPSGEVITFNLDGTLSVTNDADAGFNNFTYTVDNGLGGTDTAIVTINALVPCFTTGAMILTTRGERPVEDLQVGDFVVTRDRGPQPIRFIAKRDLGKAQLDEAPHLKPIVIRAGAFGPGLPSRDLTVSPQHRMVLAGGAARLLFDEDEVMSAAIGLVDGKSVRVAKGKKRVTYHHLMFDKHEVIFAEGAATESFHPGQGAIKGLDDSTRSELFEIFPELKFGDLSRIGPPVRPLLRTYEAKVMRNCLFSPLRPDGRAEPLLNNADNTDGGGVGIAC